MGRHRKHRRSLHLDINNGFVVDKPNIVVWYDANQRHRF